MRNERIQEQIRRIIARCLTDRRKFALPGLVTVSRVSVASGCQHAKVYVSVYGDSCEKKDVVHMLSEYVGALRKELSSCLHMRRIPTLTFVHDDSAVLSAKNWSAQGAV